MKLSLLTILLLTVNLGAVVGMYSGAFSNSLGNAWAGLIIWMASATVLVYSMARDEARFREK